MKPFKVINCLSQGFAVAGPPVLADGDHDRTPGIDLEMVLWGVAYDKAVAMAEDLNADPQLKRLHD